MARFEGETFTGRVDLDGNTYHGCKFEEAQLVYSGGQPPSFVECGFNAPRFTFEGAAGNSIAFMKALASDPGMRVIIKDTFPTLFGN